MIMFVGAFSAGKSTLINSLLGEDKCATGIRPTKMNGLEEYPWNGCLLVDSTGLDAWNKPEYKQKAFEAARRSNRAVLVINARQPLKDQEAAILKQLLESQSEITVAINYWNHVETEKDRSEVKTWVHGCLKQIMRGYPVEVIPVNAKSGNDPGVQKLSQHLSLAGGYDQKLVSADAAIRNAAQQMLNQCEEYEEKEVQTCEKKLADLKLNIAILEKEVKHLDALQRRDEKDLKMKKQELRQLHEQRWSKGQIWGFVLSIVGGAAGARLGGIGGAVAGGISGAFAAYRAKEEWQQLSAQIEEKNEEIKNLKQQMIENAAADEKKELLEKKEDREQEMAAFNQKMKDILADRAVLKAFLWNEIKSLKRTCAKRELLTALDLVRLHNEQPNFMDSFK